MEISLIDIEENMPSKVVGNDFFGEELLKTRNRMFMGTRERRHFASEDTAAQSIFLAANSLLERLNLRADRDVDMILTNVSIPDQGFTGCGAVVNKLIGGKAKWILDFHNTGCVSFIYMLEAARAYMAGQGVKTALVANVQNAAGRVFAQEDNRYLPQSSIPGDGCAVAYVTAGTERPLLETVQESYPDYAQDMFMSCEGKNWWEAREKTGNIDFSESKSARIMMRGNRLVPAIVQQLCQKLGFKTTDLDYLITNQPNPFFLRNWREALFLSEEKHLHTFPKYANLFGAAIPITFAEAMKKNVFKKGDLICLGGFSHAGDYAAATMLRF